MSINYFSANLLVWDKIAKLQSPLQVYTHHKYMLWWCFKNQAHNVFSSEVVSFSVHFRIIELYCI